MSHPRIKTNYQSLMKELKYSVDDLVPSVRKVYLEFEKNVGILTGMYDQIDKLEDGPEKDELTENIESTEAIILEQDKNACAALKRNKGLKDKAAQMQSARKHNQPGAKAASKTVEKKDDSASKGATQAPGTTAPAAQAKPDNPAQSTEKPAASPAKNNTKEETPVVKAEKKNTGKVWGWLLGGAVALVGAYFAIPLPNIKDSFTLKLKK